MERENQNVPVFIKSMATQLMKMGFNCVDEVKNYKKEDYSVFYFENTEEVNNAIKELSMDRGRKIFKLKNRNVANELTNKGYELLNIRHTKTDGIQFIFKWTETIYDDMLVIRKGIYGD